METIKVHYFQHVEFEGLGRIEEWVTLSRHSLTATKFFDNIWFPEISDFDILIIMGGPMSVNEENKFPWLAEEKKFIRKAIDAGKVVIGICLGSQLVSAALGAKVYQNKEKEIGWFDIELTCFAKSDKLFFDMDDKLKVFQWHGDTFDIPEKAVHLAFSKGCKNQAYSYKDKVLALQFHLEPTQNSLRQMVDAGRDELKSARYVQTEQELLRYDQLIESSREILFTLLNRMAQQ